MKKIKIYFIEKSTDFNSDDLSSFKIAGSEKTLINITNALGKKEHLDIKVFNNTTKEKVSNNVSWVNINNINHEDKPDYLIAMSDANLLNFIKSNKNFLWSHSVQPIEKFIRKKQFFSFLTNKPIVLLEGEYHYKTRSFFTALYGKKIIKLAPDYDFISTQIDVNKIPAKKAIFTTRSDRNLIFLLKCWSQIYKNSSQSELYINPPYNLDTSEEQMQIKVRAKSSKDKLINELLDCRVMLNPGHKGEVYCLAAEEARELCLPIVTMGFGSLYERVDHNVTGFIANNEKDFINYSIDILNNDSTYLKLKENLFKIKGIRTYEEVSNNLLDIINESG